jgi:hypothetical protein
LTNVVNKVTCKAGEMLTNELGDRTNATNGLQLCTWSEHVRGVGDQSVAAMFSSRCVRCKYFIGVSPEFVCECWGAAVCCAIPLTEVTSIDVETNVFHVSERYSYSSCRWRVRNSNEFLGYVCVQTSFCVGGLGDIQWYLCASFQLETTH